MVLSENRNQGASVPNWFRSLDPTEKPCPLGAEVSSKCMKVRLYGVNRQQLVRHGSEQRIVGHLSLNGVRGGDGDRINPFREVGQTLLPLHLLYFSERIWPYFLLSRTFSHPIFLPKWMPIHPSIFPPLKTAII